MTDRDRERGSREARRDLGAHPERAGRYQEALRRYVAGAAYAEREQPPEEGHPPVEGDRVLPTPAASRSYVETIAAAIPRRKTMSIARDIMHIGAECIDESETLAMAARKMRDLHVGALPICGVDDRLHGIITDRDIVVRCVAEGQDPQAVTARDLAHGTPIWVDAGTEAHEVVRVMTDHKIRRLPVLEGHRLVGMISEADVATHLSPDEVSEFASAIYGAPPNN